MIIIIGLAFFVFLCFLVYQCQKKGGKDPEGWFVGGGVLAVLLLIALIVLPLSRMGIKASIKGFEAIEDTLESARRSEIISPYELAAIQQKVVEVNKWLASTKYWAENPLVNWYYPKDFLKLQPIR